MRDRNECPDRKAEQVGLNMKGGEEEGKRVM